MNSVPKITALAITLNEAETIESFLESLDFVDEIIIVDSYSTDDTVALATKFDKVTVYERKFDDFSSQKNYAISKASNDWVLFFDPDEEITPSVKEEIQQVLQNPSANAYMVRRQLYFMGKKIKYSGFQTDWVVRLFHKKYCRYNGNLVHETIDVEGPTGQLKTRVPHHTYKSYDDYVGKLNHYSKLQAQMLFEKKKKAGWYEFIVRPSYRFWHQYILRLGILDGKEGYILATINAHSVFRRYAYLRLLNRNLK